MNKFTGYPCKRTENCQKNVPAKFFLVNQNKRNLLQDPQSGAWLPAITVCNQDLAPEIQIDVEGNCE